MAKRRRRRRSGLTTLLIVFVVTAAVGVIGYQIFTRVVQRTGVIESGDLGNQYIAQAVIMRDEEVVDTEGLTSVKYGVDEGELVYKGQKIAEVYSTGYSQTDVNKLLTIRSNIKTHVKSLLASNTYNDAQLDRLDGSALDYARELGMLVNGKAEGNLVNLERQLTGALTRRQTYLREKYYASDPTLAGLYDDEATLVKKIQSWTTSYLADRDCIISFYTDGWETLLPVAGFDEISPDLVSSVLAGDTPQLSTVQRGRTAVFRKVNPNGWYLLLLSTDKNWQPVTGQSYKVQLRGFDDYVFDGVVSTFTLTSVGHLVRMHVSGDVRPVLNARTAVAQVGEQYVSGLKVPVGALLTQGEYEGVVLTDSGGIFVPVQVIMRDNDYAVIQALTPGALYEGQRIRLF